MSKYLNKKTEVDGILFDSKKEASYYLRLKEMETKGEINNLRRQVPYELIPAVYRDEVKHLKTKDKTVTKCLQRATHYIADFVYNLPSGEEIVVDVKSYITRKNAEYRLKKKMMLAFNGIEITEV
ncbi:MAG: DUF1064 domain-containing protein [Bacteroidales bacterium]|nr:DUF1064 domain-containing protein [Bacteroidales bacterium]